MRRVGEIGKDITMDDCDKTKERLLAELAELRGLEEMQRMILANIAAAVLVTDDHGNFTCICPSVQTILGYSLDEVWRLGNIETLLGVDLFDPSELQRRGEITNIERTITDGAGVEHGLLISVKRMGPFHGAVVYTCRDVSERLETQKALRASEERFRALTESSIDWVWEVNAGGAYTYSSPRVKDVLGYEPEELLGRTPFELMPTVEAERVGRQFKSLIEAGRPIERVENVNLHKDGRLVVMETSGRPFFDAEGRLCGYRGIDRDITGSKLAEQESVKARYELELQVEKRTAELVRLNEQLVREIEERKMAEHQLRESEERYRVITHNSLTGIYIHQDKLFVYVNDQMAAIAGYTPEEMLGKPFGELVYPEDREMVTARVAARSRGLDVVPEYEFRLLCKGGDYRWVHVLATTILYRGHTAIMGNLVDITERKGAEQERETLKSQLAQAQKMEAIGTLAGGIAHDFNNLLTIIQGYSELLLADMEEADPNYPDLQKIINSAQSGADLVQRLLTFSRKVETKPQFLNLNHQIEQIERLLSRTLPKMIDIELILSPDLATINADPAQVDQVILNLSVNASNAMPQGGKLTLETGNVMLDDEFCRTHLGLKPGEHVLFTVSDTGHGMDEEALDRIFEPYYTSASWDSAKGRGLGLAIVQGIVESHHGHIACYSRSGEGTTFRIYFPVAQAGEEPAGPPVPNAPSTSNETILLVDDEELIRGLGERILRRAGYQVIQASDGREALNIYGQEGSKIALVVLDIVMPEMGGRECLAELLKMDPGAKVLIASGYSSSEDKKDFLRAGAKGFVAKPFNIAKLLNAVRDALDPDDKSAS